MKIVLFLVAVVSATTFFAEDFSSGWEKRWVQSTHKPEAERGELVADESGGVKTATDARFYQYSAKIAPFSNKGKDLVLQFSVANRQNIDCGGAYWKLLPALDQSKFNGDSPYFVMFGPDICGSTKRTHAIITHKDKNHLIKKDLNVQSDKFTHVYTFIIKADHKTFDVLIDNVSERSGQITDEWDILPPKKINDPAASKPADWVDSPKMDDPTDVKPAGWDDIPAQIADPEASKPNDWDDDLDGKWTAPLIDNPEYKGEWKAKQIDNPAYKGPWIHPQIDNPDFKEDNTIADFNAISAIGLEVWQVKSGTVFDNLLVTDSIEEAKKAADAILEQQKKEKAEDEKKQAEEKAKAEEAAEKAKAEAEATKAAETKDEL
jgi:calreticulin